MEKSCAYRAWLNGLVERCNRSITNVAKTIMQQCNLPAEFWAHAVCTAAYTINRLSHRRLPGGITPFQAMFGSKPDLKNLRVFGCHAEVLIEKQYRRKDLTSPNSDSAIFIGYCRQSSGYLFYIPHKHSVVSRRDASFNESYFPARVGDTKLIHNTDKITDAKEDNCIGDTDPIFRNSVNKSDSDSEQRVSPRPLLGSDGKPVASAVPMFNELFDSYKNRGYNTKKSDIISDNLKLLLDPDSIIRCNIKIAKAAPHIHERCTKAEGKSITEALKITYTHQSNPDEPSLYKRADIKYDIQKQWICLESPSSGGLVDIEIADRNDVSINAAPEEASPPRTPLSTAATPLRPTDYYLRSSVSRPSPSTSNSDARTHMYNLRGRPVMPAILGDDDDSVSAMLERGTINRDLMLSMQALGFGDEPLSYKESRLRPDSHKWAKAEDIEWQAILSYGTFKWITYEEMYKINPFARVIPTKWCYKQKPDREKARVVAKGFCQSPWDVGETYSSVAKLSTVRALLSKAAVANYSIRQLDIGNAYLCADIASEHVFCSPPEGREREGYVMYLQKALYGLKNSAKAWADTFSTFLVKQGYQRSHYDECLWEYKKGKKRLFIVVFVDDCLVIGDDEFIDDFMSRIKKEYKIRDLGEAENFLGMEITRNRDKRTIKISQNKYITNMAKKFGLDNAKPIYTPMDPRADLSKAKNKSELHDNNELYRSIVGSIMYCVQLCRPDCMYAISKLSRYLNEPTKAHMTQAKRCLVYLYTSREQGIIYGRKVHGIIGHNIIYGYADADFATDVDSRKSTTGWIFMYNGGAISWRSQQQSVTALSTSEAEYMALSDSAKEARSLLKINLSLENENPNNIKIFEDNRGCIKWTSTQAEPNRTKHIDIHYHHIKDWVKLGKISIVPVETDLQLADALTKALNRERHWFLVRKYCGHSTVF